MKFVLFVFLGLCAISAQAYPSVNENSRGLISDVVRDFIKVVTTEVEKINHESQTTLVILKDIAKSVIYQGVQLVSDRWAKVNVKLDKLRHGGDKAKNCVEKYTPALESAKNVMKMKVNNCTEKFVNQTHEIKQELKNGVTMIKNSTRDFYLLVDECASFNPIKSVKCVYNSLGKYKDYVFNLISSVKDKIVEVKERAQNASRQAATCTANAAFEFGETESTITGLMHECMQEKTLTSLPEELTTVEVEVTTPKEAETPEVEVTQATETPEPEVEETQATEEEQTQEPEVDETEVPEEVETHEPEVEETETQTTEEVDTAAPEVEQTETQAPEEVDTSAPETSE